MQRYTDWMMQAALHAMFLAVPLSYISGSFDGNGQAKTLAFILFVSIISAIFAIKIIITQKFCFGKLTNIDKCTLLYIGYVFVYVIIYDNIATERYIELLGLGVLYILIRNVELRNASSIIMAIFISGILQASYGMLQFISVFHSNNQFFHITGGFNNPGPFGGYMALSLLLGLYSLKQVKSSTCKCHNSLLEFGLFIVFVSLIISQSRAAWLSLILAFLYIAHTKFGISIGQHVHKKIYRRGLKFGLVIILIAILFFLFHLKFASSISRIYIWKIACSIITKDNFLLGIGYDTFSPSYMTAQEEYFLEHPSSPYANYADNILFCFNDILQNFVELGLIGTLLLGFALFFIFKAESPNKALSRTLKSVVLSVFVFSLFSYPSHILPIKIVECTCIAILSSSSVRNQSFDNEQNLIKGFMIFCLSGIALVGSVYVYRYFNALKDWENANYFFTDYRYRESLIHYKKAFSFFKRNGVFLNNYGKALSLSQKYAESNTIMSTAIKLNINTFSYITIAHNYEMLGDDSLAEKFYWKAHYVTPKMDFPLYSLVMLYNRLGDSSKVSKIGYKILSREHRGRSVGNEEINKEIEILIKKQQ